MLFVRPRDREMEVWNGRRAGVEGAVTYGADAAYTVDELDAKLREYAIDRTALVYRLGNAHHDPRMIRLVAEMRGVRTRGFATPVRVEDPGPILHELRLRRSPEELRASAAPARSARCPRRGDGYVRPGQSSTRSRRRSSACSRRTARRAMPIRRSWRRAQRDHPAIQREQSAHGGRRTAADRRGLRVGLPRRRHDPHLPRERALHPAPAALYTWCARAARRHQGRAAGNRYEAMHVAARRALVEGLVALRLCPRGRRVARHASLPRILHARHRPWLGMDVQTSATTASDAVAGARAGWWSRRSRSLLRPDREAVPCYLREYSEEEMCRRYRLGTAAAKKIEDEEKARAEKVEHRVPPSTGASASASRTTS